MKKIRLLTYLPLLAAFLLSCGLLPAQAPCLKEWQYVRSVNINNITGNVLGDFQVRLTMNTQALVAAGKMKADGSDIRFTTGDCCTELPVFIQSGMNTASTRIWTRVPYVGPSSAIQIRIYYGNPNATPIESIDSVMSVMGNDSMGGGTLMPNVTITSQRDTFVHPARTVRWKIYSQDTARFKFKVANDTNMVTGTSPFFTTPSTPGFYTYDYELQVVAGGYPGFYSPDSLKIMNSCDVSCPALACTQTYGNGDLVIFGALDSVVCTGYPNLRLWYRRSTFFDPVVSLVNNEFNRMLPFSLSTSGPTTICPLDTVHIQAPNIAATTYQWFQNGVPISGATDTIYSTQADGSYFCVATFGTCQTVISDTVTVQVNRPSVDLGADTTMCTDSTYMIDAGAGFSSYLWNTGDTTSQIIIDTTGTYAVLVSDSIGCSVWDSVHVTIFPLPTPELVPNGPVNFCNGGSVTLDAYNPDWYAYIWNVAGVTSSNYVVDTPGSYYVVVYDLNGCTDTSETITVTIYPDPILDLGNDTTLCLGDSVMLNAGVWDTITWAWGYTGSFYSVRFPGLYVVTVTDTNGCSSSDSAFINFLPLPEVDLQPYYIVCPGNTVSIDVGTDYAIYDWNSGDATRIITADAGYYRVTVTDSAGCSGVSNLVTVEEYPVTSAPSISGDADGLTATTAYNYQWYRNGVALPGQTSNFYDPDSSGDYYVEFVDSNGCGTYQSNVISILLIFDITQDDIPEGFSPNEDGINDNFAIRNLDFFPNNSFKVFNRWGQMVFSREPYTGDFNGFSSSGDVLPDGTYFYIFDVGNGQEPFNGSIIINR